MRDGHAHATDHVVAHYHMAKVAHCGQFVSIQKCTKFFIKFFADKLSLVKNIRIFFIFLGKDTDTSKSKRRRKSIIPFGFPKKKSLGSLCDSMESASSDSEQESSVKLRSPNLYYLILEAEEKITREYMKSRQANLTRFLYKIYKNDIFTLLHRNFPLFWIKILLDS